MRQLILTLYLSVIVWAIQAQSDTNTILGYNEYMELVKKNHPIALQAELQLQVGEAFVQQARGGFDPKLQYNLKQKYFEEKEYYELGEGKLKIPTWFGIELEGGYEKNEGVFLNPENNVPNTGLWFAGVSVSIGEGLFIDERRAELRKAQLMINQTQAERDIIRNNLLLNAGSAYWDWFMNYHSLLVYQEVFEVAKERFDAVRQNVLFGADPAIDTIEAGIQVQRRKLSLQQAQLDFMNSSAYLSTFLWKDGIIPLELDKNVQPLSKTPVLNNISPTNFSSIDSLINNHPELRRNGAVLDQLNIDRRWAREQLKPTLNLNYKPITELNSTNTFDEYSINNYTWGVEFEFPIFLRKERGKLNLIQAKLNETEYKLNNKRQQLIYKVNASINEYKTTSEQLQVSKQTAEDYEILFEGEKTLFKGGESSLFVVNARELGFVSAQIKLIELISKNKKTLLKTQYALGNL